MNPEEDILSIRSTQIKTSQVPKLIDIFKEDDKIRSE